jgi:hypothetical protein
VARILNQSVRPSFVGLGLFQRGDLCIGQHQAFLRGVSAAGNSSEFVREHHAGLHSFDSVRRMEAGRDRHRPPIE